MWVGKGTGWRNEDIGNETIDGQRDVTLGEFSEIQGLLGKVRISDVTYYAASSDSERMIQLQKIGPVIPVPETPEAGGTDD